MTRVETTSGAARPTRSSSHRPLLVLCGMTGTLAAVAAGVGLFSAGGVGPFTATSVHGETVQMYGRGVYEFDSLFHGSGQRGVDAVVLFVAMPLLVISVWYFRRGSLRALLVLTGTLTFFTYVGISYLGAVAYNELFFVYVALFSASLFALRLAFSAIDRDQLAQRIDERMPRRVPATFLFFSAFVTTAAWLMAPLEGLMKGEPPAELETYTSLFTTGFDIAVIVPSLVLSGVLILRRDPLGYALGIPLTLFAALLAPMISAMTVVQLRAGVEFTPGQVIGPISGFVVLAAVAIWLVVSLLSHVSETAR